MPRQKFCSVPGCLSTTELIKREQEAFLATFCERCSIRRPCRCPAPDIYTTRKETRTKFTSWCSAIGLKDPGYYINVCYKHFSTGCPSRSCPNPDVVVPIWEKHIRERLRQQQQPQQDPPPPPQPLKKTKIPTTKSLLQKLKKKRKRTPSTLCDLLSSLVKDGRHCVLATLQPAPCSVQSLLPRSPLPKDEIVNVVVDEVKSEPEPTPPQQATDPLAASAEGIHLNFSDLDFDVFESIDIPVASEVTETVVKEEMDLDEVLSNPLLNQDPCLNEGNPVMPGRMPCLAASPFIDELDNMHKWLEICDVGGTA